MKTYTANFIGRRVDAIGVTYPITTTVQGISKEDATLNLYKSFDHIFGLQLNEVHNYQSTGAA